MQISAVKSGFQPLNHNKQTCEMFPNQQPCDGARTSRSGFKNKPSAKPSYLGGCTVFRTHSNGEPLLVCVLREAKGAWTPFVGVLLRLRKV